MNAGDKFIASFVKYSIEKYQRNAILTVILIVFKKCLYDSVIYTVLIHN